jgi:hypothetical protein
LRTLGISILVLSFLQPAIVLNEKFYLDRKKQLPGYRQRPPVLRLPSYPRAFV